ncbi:MAG TPA: FeoA family protein [Longimicrobiales bacterium]
MIGRVRAARRRKKKLRELAAESDLRLAHIPLREMVELVRIDLPSDEVEPLLEVGLLPGCRLCPVRRTPFGDAVLMVDGALIALRRETAGCLCVRRAEPVEN